MDITLFQTESGNDYLHSKKNNQFLWCHPVTAFLLDLRYHGVDLEAWATTRGPQVEIPGHASISASELRYYLDYVRLLDDGDYLATLAPRQRKGAGRLTGEAVRASLANTHQISLEVTEVCNLDCKYCAYLDLYQDKNENRDKATLGFERARGLLEYVFALTESPLNRSIGNKIDLNFYGGEPLLGINFIERVVAYVESRKLEKSIVTFGMTTNGLLLERHMDFLAEKRFRLLISLDGNEQNNRLRVFRTGKPSHEKVVRSVKMLQAKYPEYFASSNVSFNSVIHVANSVEEAHRYIKDTFGKVPRVAALSSSGIAPEMIDEFWRTYRNVADDLRKSQEDNPGYLMADMFLDHPEVATMVQLLKSRTGFVFDTYTDLMFDIEPSGSRPSGSCTPFSRKVFLNAQGRVLPCERVAHEYTLGRVDGDGNVALDFDDVARRYNELYDKMEQLCGNCHNSTCSTCMLTLDLSKPVPDCPGFVGRPSYAKFLGQAFDHFDGHRDEYLDLLKDVKMR